MFLKLCLYVIIWRKCGRARQTQNRRDNRHKLKVFTTYCLSTAKMVTRTRHYVTLYEHCLPVWLWKIPSPQKSGCTKLTDVSAHQKLLTRTDQKEMTVPAL
jgi:hypothetical protein